MGIILLLSSEISLLWCQTELSVFPYYGMITWELWIAPTSLNTGPGEHSLNLKFTGNEVPTLSH